MTEAEMSVIVTEYLRALDYRVFAEVVAMSGTIDLVAVRSDLKFPVVIELKKSLTYDLVRQTTWKKIFSPFVWAVVSTRPKDTERLTKHGVGIATVAGGSIQVIHKPIFDRWCYNRRPSRLNYLVGTENGLGGIPSPAPAQVAIERIKAYVQANPITDWTAVFENVPNHYANPRSMYGALRLEVGFSIPLRRKGRVEIVAGQLGLFE